MLEQSDSLPAIGLHRLLLLLFVGLVAVAPALAARPRVTVDVRRDADVFRIDAVLFAPVSPDLAWEVLTDFENMERFVPNVRDSRIVARDDRRLTIRQRGVARFGLLTFSFESERLVELTPRSQIRSTQTSGNMNSLQSLTRFSAHDGGTRLDYHVDVEPGALFPGALTQRFLVHEIQEQFEAIAAEMQRRSALRGAAAPTD